MLLIKFISYFKKNMYNLLWPVGLRTNEWRIFHGKLEAANKQCFSYPLKSTLKYIWKIIQNFKNMNISLFPFQINILFLLKKMTTFMTILGFSRVLCSNNRESLPPVSIFFGCLIFFLYMEGLSCLTWIPTKDSVRRSISELSTAGAQCFPIPWVSAWVSTM